MDDVVVWIQEVFEDCSFRAPIGIGWELDRAEPPITAIVTPISADRGEPRSARQMVQRLLGALSSKRSPLRKQHSPPVAACLASPGLGPGLAVTRACERCIV